MTATLLIALFATLPAGALAYTAALIVERAGAGLKLRSQAWALAMATPLLAAGLTAAASLQAKPVVTFAAPVAHAPFSGGAVEDVYDLAIAAADARQALDGGTTAWTVGAILLAAIIAGMAARAVVTAVMLARLARTRRYSQPFEDGALAALVGLEISQVRVAEVASPMLTGLHRPTILIPRPLAETLNRRQLELICRHELSHFKARHHLAALGQEAFQCLLWFNPFFAAARRRFTATVEELADREALTGAAAGERRLYAETLLAAFRHAGRAPALNAFTGALARRRIVAVLKPRVGGSLAARLVAVPLLAGLSAAIGLGSLVLAAEPSIRALPAATVSTAAARIGDVIEARTTQLAAIAAAAPPAAAPPQRPGPIDYAKPPGAATGLPIQFNCTLTPEGRATGCAAVETDREPERAAKAIAEIEARVWPVGPQPPGPPSKIGVMTASGVREARTVQSRDVISPGPMSAWLYPDGRLRGSGRVRSEMVSPDGQAAQDAMFRDMEQSIRERLSAPPRIVRDDTGREVGQVGRAVPGYKLIRPVALHLDGRTVGQLESDATGGLWFNGRQTVDRGTPVPVLDRDNVLRARRSLADLAPGDQSLLKFAPIEAGYLVPAAAQTPATPQVSTTTLRGKDIVCQVTVKGRAEQCRYDGPQPDPDPAQTARRIAAFEARTWEILPG